MGGSERNLSVARAVCRLQAARPSCDAETNGAVLLPLHRAGTRVIQVGTCGLLNVTAMENPFRSNYVTDASIIKDSHMVANSG